MDKITKLEKLKREIELKYGFDKVHFFKKKENIQGYMGTQDIMFIGLNPSDSKNRTSTNRIKTYFDTEIIKNGFENAHVTDFIKLWACNKKVEDKVWIKDILQDETIIKEQAFYLDKEIGIINPRLIVSMGKKCKELMEEYLPKRNCEFIWHYAWARYNKNKIKYADKMIYLRTLYNDKKHN